MSTDLTRCERAVNNRCEVVVFFVCSFAQSETLVYMCVSEMKEKTTLAQLQQLCTRASSRARRSTTSKIVLGQQTLTTTHVQPRPPRNTQRNTSQQAPTTKPTRRARRVARPHGVTRSPRARDGSPTFAKKSRCASNRASAQSNRTSDRDSTTGGANDKQGERATRSHSGVSVSVCVLAHRTTREQARPTQRTKQRPQPTTTFTPESELLNPFPSCAE